jgi:hypothetical protein
MSTKRRAPRRQGRKNVVQLAFEALSIEGGLISPTWLTNIAQLKADDQKEADYRVPKGLNLRDEIGRYWRIAQAGWKDFETALNAAKSGADPKSATERWVLSLLCESLGFSSLQTIPPVELDGRTFPIGHSAINRRVPVVIAAPNIGIDSPVSDFGEDGKRRSAFGLAQEFLNADTNSLWGITSDGVVLRVLRDNASLTRPAWIEVDLQRIFTEERYADFAAFWLICHETRFGREDRPPSDSALETWRNAGRQEGTRAREFLRQGVEEALLALGQGFLAHSENQGLRSQIQSGQLSTRDYFNQLLRLVYRLIFLLTVEERNLLHPEGTSEDARKLYSHGYSLKALREASVRRSAHDRFSDRWEAVKIVFRGLATGEPRLGIPALAGIFTKHQCPALDSSRLANSDLLLAVLKLAWIRDESGLARVNWRDMGPEELGSVYESLLELVPQVSNESRTFSFASGAETKGNARKTSGSYYTPDSLVQVLLDSALEPVVADTLTRNPSRPVEALLNLSIVDPASGSGHFLLAAARRLAAHVARLQAGGTPSAAEYRHALRQVIGRCIYGVDLNPMAVELCKVSLWMEAVEPGLPLTFLDSHIQQGNALIGATPELMAMGVPDDAWQPIEGDDKKIASALKKRNKAESDGGQRAFALTSEITAEAGLSLNELAEALDRAPDTDLASLEKKADDWQAFFRSATYQRHRFTADTWCAAFVWPKEPGVYNDSAPTNGLWRQVRDGQGVPPALARLSTELAEEYSFFHWHLAFPQVFANGGFDVVLGNPPWDKIQPEEEKFFAAIRPDIANAPTARQRKALIASLSTDAPETARRWLNYKRQIEGQCHILGFSRKFRYSGDGNLNSYRLFTELATLVNSRNGRTGLVVQSGLGTDESGKELFDHLLSSGRMVRFLDFENRQGFFPQVDSRFRFCLLTLRGTGTADSARSEFGWLLQSLADLRNPDRLVTLSATDLLLFNPTSRTCPIFLSNREVVLSRRIYEHGQHVMLDNDRRFGSIDFLGELFNMTRDSEYFEELQTPDHFPLYEAKFIHQFDHRFATQSNGATREVTAAEKSDLMFQVTPKSWVSKEETLQRVSSRSMSTRWMAGFRSIARATDERTVIMSALPFCAVGNSFNLVLGLTAEEFALLLANANSFVFDFCARKKISGSNVNIWIVKQLPIIPLQIYQSSPQWLPRESELSQWIRSRVLELVYTASDLKHFAIDLGHSGQPFKWDQERRHLLRCELDAAFFHLYGISREDADYIMDTFPLTRRNDESQYNEYRTKRVILEIYDDMTEAARTKNPYQTRLDPPPADSRVAHQKPNRSARA